MRRIAILDAPSNLGLRPPTETSVPGCAKAPGALRDHGLLARLGARDAGCLTPPRYDPGDWRPGDGVCHANEISVYSRKLADRIGAILDLGEFPVVLGGDCSIVLGSGLAMHRLGEAVGGRIGLVFVDGHSDFRHPGNASYVGAAAGEDLALVTGRGQPDLAAMEGRRPYFRDIDVVVMGIRPQDEYRLDLQAAGIVTRPVPTLRVEGAARSAQWARDQLVDCAGYWVHVDMDVLDPAVMPAVDAPEPGGIAFPELEILLAGLVDTPHCLGVEITVFDPDYDPDGSYAEEITSALVAGLTPVRHADARPDLIAARDNLNTTPTPTAPPVTPPAAPAATPPTAPTESDLPTPAATPPAASGASPSAGSLMESSAPSSLASSTPFLASASQRAGEPWPVEEHDPIEARRAAAAAESVTLAAAGMSSGPQTPDGSTEEPAVPATTLLAVEEAAEVESYPPDDPDPATPEPPDTGETAKPEKPAPPSEADDAEPPTAHWTAAPPDDEQAGEHPAPTRETPEDSEPQEDASAPAELHEIGSVAADTQKTEHPEDAAPTNPNSGKPTPDRADWLGSPRPRADWLAPSTDRADWLSSPGRLGTRSTNTPGRLGTREPEADSRLGTREPDAQPRLGTREPEAPPRLSVIHPDQPLPTEPPQAQPEQIPEPSPESKEEAPHRPPQPTEDPDQSLRPLGDLPQLDSSPLPATRPGLLRPRDSDEEDPAGFTLPAQRPAFDLGTEEPEKIPESR